MGQGRQHFAHEHADAPQRVLRWDPLLRVHVGEQPALIHQLATHRRFLTLQVEGANHGRRQFGEFSADC